MTEKINDNFKEMLKQKISLERFGLPDDVANAVVFLSSNSVQSSATSDVLASMIAATVPLMEAIEMLGAAMIVAGTILQENRNESIADIRQWKTMEPHHALHDHAEIFALLLSSTSGKRRHPMKTKPEPFFLHIQYNKLMRKQLRSKKKKMLIPHTDLDQPSSGSMTKRSSPHFST